MSIDLSGHPSTLTNCGSYQLKLTATTTTASPLILSKNVLSICVGSYYKRGEGLYAESISTGSSFWVYIGGTYRLCSELSNLMIQRSIPML